MSDYVPKVGDRVKYPSGEGKVRIADPDKNDVVIVIDIQGEYRRVSVFNLSPLPTEEEKMIDGLMALNKTLDGFIIDKGAAKALIKDGYRKVEPIDKKRLICDLYINVINGNENISMRQSTGESIASDIIDYMADNKHIIVKDGELNKKASL